jgi:hypothetical protein
MVVIHTAYATMKMPGPKGFITIKGNQRHALAFENASLSHVRHIEDKMAQEQEANMVKTKGGSTPHKASMFKPPTGSTPRAPTTQKGTYVAGEEGKEILTDASNLDKKLWINLNLDPK